MKGKRIQSKNKENKEKSNKKIILIILTILILLVITAVMLYFILKPKVKKEVIIELGETQQLQIEQFLEDEKYKDKNRRLSRRAASGADPGGWKRESAGCNCVEERLRSPGRGNENADPGGRYCSGYDRWRLRGE